MPLRTGLAVAVLAAACSAPAFASGGLTMSANVGTIATIDVSTNAFSFNSTDNTNAHLAANENASIPAAGNVTGSIRTSKANPGYINVVAPSGPLRGAAAGSIPISALQISCSVGTGNSGINAIPSGLALLTALAAGSSTLCAKYNSAATGTSAQVGILLSVFLDDTAIIADRYAALSGFSVSASAT